MDDGVDAGDSGAERRGVGHVAARKVDAPRLQPRRMARIADERAHRQVPRAQRVHDVRADEPGPAGDEYRHAPSCSKFCQ